MWKIVASSLASGLLAAVAVTTLQEAPLQETAGADTSALEADVRRQSSELQALRRQVEALELKRREAAHVPDSPSAGVSAGEVEQMVNRLVDEKMAAQAEEIKSGLPQALQGDELKKLFENARQNVGEGTAQDWQQRHVTRMKDHMASVVFDKLELQDWQREQMDALFTEYYKESMAMWQDRSGSWEERRDKRDELRQNRDQKVQGILDAAQYEKYTELTGQMGHRDGVKR